MNSMNIKFLETYKHLDKLLKEMFGTENGVTYYINTAINSYNLLYNNDIKKLKHFRHIRNKLTHDTDTLNTDMCTSEDIEWLEDFYQRVLSVSDPLSVCIKNQNVNININSDCRIYVNNTDYSEEKDNRYNHSSAIIILMLLGILAGLIFFFLYD